MADVSEWAKSLLRQIDEDRVKEKLPRNRQGWFLLRERWNLYSQWQRSLVLCVANIEQDLPLERYSDEQKKQIAYAIAQIHSFSKADEDLVGKVKHLLMG